MALNAQSSLSTSPQVASLQLIKALGDLFYHGRSKRTITGPRQSYRKYKKPYRKGYSGRKKRWVPYSQYKKRYQSRRRRY